MATTYEVTGTLRGELWWPIGEPAEKPFRVTFRESERPATMAEMAEAIMRAEGGDFSSDAVMLADTTLTITRHRRPYSRRTVERWFPLTAFPSLTDYVADEWPEYGEWAE